MFRKVNHWLENYTGYRIVKGGRHSLRRVDISDPRLAAYHDLGTGLGCSVLAPVELGIGFNAFSLGPQSYHPWIVAVRAAGGGDNKDTLSRTLDTYYSIVRPAVLRDWLDIPKLVCPQIDTLPKHAWSVLPWTIGNPSDIIRAIEAAQLEENRRYGLNDGMGAGAKAFGPVSVDKLRVETMRIASLYDSLRQYGLDHQRSDYNLRATFLAANGRWTWISMGGMHRVAMAAASGITQIPLRVAAVVRRNEVDIWPQVTSGLYDQATALALFDRLIERRPPKCTLPWIEWVDRQRPSSGFR